MRAPFCEVASWWTADSALCHRHRPLLTLSKLKNTKKKRNALDCLSPGHDRRLRSAICRYPQAAAGDGDLYIR